MALILKNHARDFISGAEMDFSTYSNEKIDIHHIFPKDYWIGQKYDKDFIIDRAKKLLRAIEAATGRTISGKDSDEVRQAFGGTLNESFQRSEETERGK